MGKLGEGPLETDTTILRLTFASGMKGHLRSSYVTAKERWIRVSGANGSARAEGDGSLTLQCAGGATVIVPPAADHEAAHRQILAAEIAEFAECIRSGGILETDGEAGARNLAVVLSAVESHRRKGETVWIGDSLSEAGIPE